MAALPGALTPRRPVDLHAWWVTLPTFAVAYAIAVVAGLATQLPGTPLALVWPAAAVATLWMVHARSARTQRLHAVALVLVTVAGNLMTGVSPALAAAFGAVNLLQAVVTAALLPQGFRLRTVTALGRLVLGCTAGALGSAVVGSLAAALLVDAELMSTTLFWTVRNATSAVVLVAVVLRLREHGTTTRPTAAGRGEAASAVVVLAVGLLLIATAPSVPAGLVLVPLSMWVALRCSTTVACGHLLVTAVGVVLLSSVGRGSFAQQPPETAVLLAQAFVLVVALVSLTLALTGDERAELVRRLRLEQQQSAAQAALLATVLDTVDVAIVAADAEGRPWLLNPAARTLHDLADGGPLPGAVPVDRVLREGRLSDALLVVETPGRPPRTVRSEGRAMYDPDGRLLGAVVVQTDVSALCASEQQFRAAFEDGPTPTARLDDTGRVEQVNAALRRLLSLRSSHLLGRELASLAAADDRDRLRAAAQDRTGGAPVEVRLVRADGSAVWCEVSRTRVRTTGATPYVLVQVLDVHARKTHELVLEDAAHRDALTGLDNRHVLDRRLGDLLLGSEGAYVVIAYLDLDGFKAVNDTHGHDAGDAVLVAVGQRLLRLVRNGDIAARLGGDEFVLACVVPDGQTADHFASVLTSRIEGALCSPVAHEDLCLHIGVSVGTAVAPSRSDPAEVLRRADLAMYARKRARQETVAHAGARPAPLRPDEPERLAALRAAGLLDTPPEQELDDLCQAAALVAGVPTALVSLVDEQRQWFKARCGLDEAETGRDVSFCSYVVWLDDEVHVEDARRDPRFAENPLVTGELSLRSYAGFPLRSADGHVFGTLCVLGDVPGRLDEAQRRVLRVLAAQANAVLLRRAPAAQAPALHRVPQQRTAPRAALTTGGPDRGGGA